MTRYDASVPDCSLASTDVVVVGSDPRVAEGVEKCAVAPGAVLAFPIEAPPPPLPPEVFVEPVPSHPLAGDAAVAAAPVTLAPAAPASPALSPVVEQPAAAPNPQDIAALAQQSGGGMTGIAAALIAVAGCGAAWKFYSQRAEQQHELAKEKLKMESAAQGLNGAQPPPCQAANASIEQRLAALAQRVEAAEARAAAAEKKSSSLSADFDAEDVERRVKRIERRLKSLDEEK